MTEKMKQKSRKVRKEWIQIDALSCGTGWDEKEYPAISMDYTTHPRHMYFSKFRQQKARNSLKLRA